MARKLQIPKGNEKKLVYLVRNAEAVANVKKTFSQESPLTKTGMQQARYVADYLSNKSINRIWSSHLEHARKTAEIVAQKLDLDVIIDEGIANLNTGLWESKKACEIELKWPIEWNRIHIGNLQQEELLVPGGETLSSLYTRAISSFSEIVSCMEFGTSAVLFGHNLSMAAILAHSAGSTASGLFRFELYNASISLVEVGNFGFKIIYANNIEHLTSNNVRIKSGALSGEPAIQPKRGKRDR